MILQSRLCRTSKVGTVQANEDAGRKHVGMPVV
jgi:hypothetical protein